MSDPSTAAPCPLETLTGTYVSTGNSGPNSPTTTLAVRRAPGDAATGTSKWIGKDGKTHFGEFQGEVKRMSDGQSPARSVWFGTCRIDGEPENYPFVLIASEDGTKLQGAYWTLTGIGGTWDFAAT